MRQSAGILPYKKDDGLKLFLVHMGGPYWKNRPRSWSVVKGEVEPDEDLFEAAKREFFEETGQKIEGRFIPLGSVKSSGKQITVWAVEAEPDTNIVSNTFTIEWLPRSGVKQEFPEIDKAGWFSPEEAEKIIVRTQLPLIEMAKKLLNSN